MESGRWIAHFGRNDQNHAFYSDSIVPSSTSDWVRTGFAQVAGSDRCVGAGDYGYLALTNTRIARTDDGINYSVVYSNSGSIPNFSIFVTSRGTVISYGDTVNGGPVAVSRDHAETFTVKALPGMGQCYNMHEADGRLYASGQRAESPPIIYVSDDDAETWQPVDAPWLVNFANPSAMLLPYYWESDQ